MPAPPASSSRDARAEADELLRQVTFRFVVFGPQALCLQPASRKHLLAGKHFPGSLLLAVKQSALE